jgi:hypothetical protein
LVRIFFSFVSCGGGAARFAIFGGETEFEAYHNHLLIIERSTASHDPFGDSSAALILGCKKI